MKISYESDELIAELEKDIEEFGRDEELWGFYKVIGEQKVYVNYDFIVEENEIKNDEIDENVHLERLPAPQLFKVLYK